MSVKGGTSRRSVLLRQGVRWASLAMLVFGTAVWFASYRWIVQYRSVASSGGVRDMLVVRGGIQFGRDRQLSPSPNDGLDWMLGLTVRHASHIPPGWQAFSGAGTTRDVQFAGFRFLSADPASGTGRNFWSVRIPLWFVVCLSTAVAAWSRFWGFWNLATPRHLVVLLFIVTGLCAGCTRTEGTGGELRRIGSPRTSDAEVVGLIKGVRSAVPSHEEAEIWARIANSDGFSSARRRLAVYQLFDRCVTLGMTVRDLADSLGHPTWLRRTQLHAVKNLAGFIPISLAKGEAIFVVIPGLPADDVSAIYLRVSGAPSADELYNALQGRTAAATDLRITAIGLFPADAAERELVSKTAQCTIFRKRQ